MTKNECVFIMGKAMALIEDLYISMKDPLLKNDYSHKISLLKQDMDEMIKEDSE